MDKISTGSHHKVIQQLEYSIYNYVISTNSDCPSIHYQTFESCCDRLVQLTLETGNMRFQDQSHVQIFPWVPACDYRDLKWHRHERKIDMFLPHSFIMYTSFCQLSVTTAEEPYIYIRIYYIYKDIIYILISTKKLGISRSATLVNILWLTDNILGVSLSHNAKGKSSFIIATMEILKCDCSSGIGNTSNQSYDGN